MNRKEYNGDPRYAKVLEKMDLLGIMDITTTRQDKNGTIQWKLPIKDYNTFIEVASFESGYVRVQNCGYTAYQLNKRCEGKPEYYQIGPDHWRQFTTRTCKLIPIEIERLEYLISYCLKNYYIKHANFVANGEYIPKWKHENAVNDTIKLYEGYDRVRDLEDKLDRIKTFLKHEL